MQQTETRRPRGREHSDPREHGKCKAPFVCLMFLLVIILLKDTSFTAWKATVFHMFS